MSPDDIAELQRIAARLGDQDNRCTAEIAFCVQRMNLVSGLDPQWSDNPEGIMFYLDGEAVDSDHWLRLEAAHQEDLECLVIDGAEYILADLDRTAFKYEWETVQVCFTEEGAKAYLERDGHNLSRYGKPRIYGESFYRNVEMITLRRIIPELAALVAVVNS